MECQGERKYGKSETFQISPGSSGNEAKLQYVQSNWQGFQRKPGTIVKYCMVGVICVVF